MKYEKSKMKQNEATYMHTLRMDKILFIVCALKIEKSR